MLDVKKISEAVTGQGDWDFVAECPLSLQIGWAGERYLEAEGDKKVKVPFSLDLDARPWGIKDILLALSGTVEVSYLIRDLTGEEEKLVKEGTVVVDLAKVPKEKVASNGQVTLGDLTLALNEDGSVNYENSLIETIVPTT